MTQTITKERLSKAAQQRNDIRKRRLELRRIWTEINGSDEKSAVDEEALFLLAAAQVGPRKYAQIARLSGISRSKGLTLCRRARQAGIFRDQKIAHSGWDNPENGGVAFICDVLTLKGFFERTQGRSK